MHKIVIDTNIFIAAIISRSYPYKIVHDLILKEEVISFTSSDILKEFASVISYSKFNKYPDFVLEANELLKGFERFSIVVQPTTIISVLKDEKDNMFLETAMASHADFLITGNSRHFPFGKFSSTEIISPTNYFQKYWN